MTEWMLGGWTDRWGGWMDGWMNGWLAGCMDRKGRR